MTTSRRQALPSESEGPERATFLELFFDLVYVFALTRVSQRLVDALTFNNPAEHRMVWSEAAEALIVLLALYLVWSSTAWTTNRSAPQRPLIQFVVFGSMLGSMVMAVAIPEAFGATGGVFAVAYVVMLASRPALLAVAPSDRAEQRNALRVLFWACLSAVAWLGGALAHGVTRGALWTLGLALDYVVPALGWPTPRLGRSRPTEWYVAGEHLAERYQQFLIVALGESILVIGFTFSRGAFTPVRTVAFVIAFFTTVLLWRIYFHRAGAILAEAIKAVRRPAGVARDAGYTHLLMITGIVVTGVGFELTIDHSSEPPQRAWATAILGGPALFLAGRSGFEYAVFGRVSVSRSIGMIVLIAVWPATIYLPLVLVAVVPSTVLAGIAVADAIRSRGRPPERAAPRRWTA